MKENMFAAARRASNVSVEDAANACNISRATYQQRELHPTDFRVNELLKLKGVLTPVGRKLLYDGIALFFCPDDSVKPNY